MVYKLIERSKGVVIFSVSLIFFGAFCAFLLILSIALLALRNDFPALENVMPNNILSMPMFWISSGINLLVFISWVVAGIGALHLRDWARQYLRVVMALHVINMLINIILNIFLAEEAISKISVGFLAAGILVSFSYYLGVIYFFSHPQIVRQFKFKSREY